jgi:hypothetical protein
MLLTNPFYDKVNKLRMRAEDFKVARDYQKEELLGVTYADVC